MLAKFDHGKTAVQLQSAMPAPQAAEEAQAAAADDEGEADGSEDGEEDGEGEPDEADGTEVNVSIEGVGFCGVQNWAASASTDGQLCIWDLNTMTVSGRLHRHAAGSHPLRCVQCRHRIVQPESITSLRWLPGTAVSAVRASAAMISR